MTKKQLSFLESLEEKFSNLLISDDEEHEVKSIPTGSISLDYATGIGGIPIGRFTEIYGAESSGKTTLCLSIAKNAIKTGGKVLYVDAENGLDYDYVKSIISDYSRDSFVLIQPQFAEETFMLAEEGINSGEFELIVLDSIAVLASKKEAEKDFEDSSVATMSRLISKFIKRNTYAIRNSNTAFIFINQVRDKIGAYVPVLEAPGGHAIKHICSLRISLQAGLGRDDRIMQEDEIIGCYSKFVIKKNKLAAPLKTYSFPIMYGKGIDFLLDLVPFAEIIGVLTRAGAYYRFEGENIGQGLNKTIEYLNEHQDTLDKILNLCYTQMSNNTRKEIEEVGTDKEELEYGEAGVSSL